MIGMPAYSSLVISTRTQSQLISAWATVPHIHHFFLHQSLSDSNLPSEVRLKLKFRLLFNEHCPSQEQKLSRGESNRVKIENGPATFPSFANNLASSVFIQHEAGKFSRFDWSSLACGVH
jgi:hypothetical protein